MAAVALFLAGAVSRDAWAKRSTAKAVTVEHAAASGAVPGRVTRNATTVGGAPEIIDSGYDSGVEKM
jgi:hypothetical protein